MRRSCKSGQTTTGSVASASARFFQLGGPGGTSDLGQGLVATHHAVELRRVAVVPGLEVAFIHHRRVLCEVGTVLFAVEQFATPQQQHPVPVPDVERDRGLYLQIFQWQRNQHCARYRYCVMYILVSLAIMAPLE